MYLLSWVSIKNYQLVLELIITKKTHILEIRFFFVSVLNKVDSLYHMLYSLFISWLRIGGMSKTIISMRFWS